MKRINKFQIAFLVLALILVGLTACTTKPAAGELIISVADAYQLYQDDVFVLDVRTPEEYQESHIPGATLLPLDELNLRIGELPQDETILVYCRSGNRSLEAVYMLEKAGFKRVHSMDRGINYWIQSGYEVEVGE
jgi:rhodanese-related sulfurtransferase